jgi:hypothetical protein
LLLLNADGCVLDGRDMTGFLLSKGAPVRDGRRDSEIQRRRIVAGAGPI